MEDGDAKGGLCCGDLPKEVPEKKNMWNGNCSCDILVKNVAAFFFFVQNKSS